MTSVDDHRSTVRSLTPVVNAQLVLLGVLTVVTTAAAGVVFVLGTALGNLLEAVPAMVMVGLPAPVAFTALLIGWRRLPQRGTTLLAVTEIVSATLACAATVLWHEGALMTGLFLGYAALAVRALVVLRDAV